MGSHAAHDPPLLHPAPGLPVLSAGPLLGSFYASLWEQALNYSQWATERHKCESCRHILVESDPKQDKPRTILRCALWPSLGRGKRRIYAIYAREEDRCGLEGRSWEPPA